ncbi:hypothetical protein U1Q18_047261 [Sarracenia purpurea var. burkii]
MDDKTAFEILTGISATTKVIFTDNIGHQTIKALSHGITNILVDPNTSKSITAGVQGIEKVMRLKKHVEIGRTRACNFQGIAQIGTNASSYKYDRSGLKRLIEQPGINKAIKKAFSNLVTIVQKV